MIMKKGIKKRESLVEMILEAYTIRLHKEVIVDAINNGESVHWNETLKGKKVSDRISEMRNLDGFFVDLKPHASADLSSWSKGVSHIQSMEETFKGTIGISLNIGNWDVSNVDSVRGIFMDATVTDSGFASWGSQLRNTVTNYSFAYSGATIKVDLSSWEPKEAIDISHLFSGTEEFVGSISKWNLNRVRDFSYVFEKGCKLNQDISSWKMSAAETVKGMFFENTEFKGDLTPWAKNGMIKPSLDMCIMFENSTYDGDLSNWDVSKVKLKDDMFKNNKHISRIPRGLTAKAIKALDKKAVAWANSIGDIDGAIDSTVKDVKKAAKRFGHSIVNNLSSVGSGAFALMGK